MEQDYTANKLIQLIYDECDIFDRLELEDAIENDATLRQSYVRLQRSYKALPKVTFSPATKTINNILSFASNQLNATA